MVEVVVMDGEMLEVVVVMVRDIAEDEDTAVGINGKAIGLRCDGLG